MFGRTEPEPSPGSTPHRTAVPMMIPVAVQRPARDTELREGDCPAFAVEPIGAEPTRKPSYRVPSRHPHRRLQGARNASRHTPRGVRQPNMIPASVRSVPEKQRTVWCFAIPAIMQPGCDRPAPIAHTAKNIKKQRFRTPRTKPGDVRIPMGAAPGRDPPVPRFLSSSGPTSRKARSPGPNAER